MSVTILFVALVVFAFFAAHLINRYAARVVSISGAEYLVIGALIGPHVPPRVLTVDALGSLAPLVTLLLGLSGFLIGLQAARLRELRLGLVGLGVALSTLVGMALIFAALYGWLVPMEEPPLVQRWLFEIEHYNVELLLTRSQAAVAIVIAAIATVTYSSTFSGAARERLDGVPAFRLLRSSASRCPQRAGFWAWCFWGRRWVSASRFSSEPNNRRAVSSSSASVRSPLARVSERSSASARCS
jgi:hypothetical protein